MSINRRKFLQTTTAAGLGASLGVLGAPAIAAALFFPKLDCSVLPNICSVWMPASRFAFSTS